MTVLYLDRKTLELRREGRALLVRNDGERLTTVPLRLLERVVIRGLLQLDTGVLYHLAQAGIPVIILGRRSDQLAVVQNSMGPDARRRLQQYQRFSEPVWRRQWARALVLRKLIAQRRLLLRLQRRRPELRKPLHDAREQLAAASNELAVGDPALAVLRGIEGQTAKQYFVALRPAFPASLGFTHRNRRPPTDPVNAVLSLGYTLLHAELVIACHQQGLDPYIGFYHEPSHGRESLASDLIEPLRPLVDAWAQALFAERQLRGHHFHHQGRACLLDKPGRQVVYRSWEHLARPLRRYIQRLAPQVLRAIAPRSE
jgi:CRISPR-associated protein Cas1